MIFRRLNLASLRAGWERISSSRPIRCSGHLSRIHFLLQDLAENMSCQNVRLLDTGRVRRGHLKQKVSRRSDLASAFARKGYRHCANFSRGFKGQEDVSTVSRSRDGYDNIALACERLDLTLKDMLVAVVVACGGQDGRVGGESNRGDAGAIKAKTNYQLAVQMLRIRGAAAVAAPQYLAAHADGEDHLGCDLIENMLLVSQGFNDLDVFGQSCLEDSGAVWGGFWHGISYS